MRTARRPKKNAPLAIPYRPPFRTKDEPALRSQAQWLEQHLGLSDEFFARFLRISECAFRDWRLEQAPLSSDRQDSLRVLRRTVLYLHYFTNYDMQQFR